MKGAGRGYAADPNAPAGARAYHGIGRDRRRDVLEPGINWFTLKRQDAKRTLVDGSQRSFLNKAMQGFHAQRKLRDGQAPFTCDGALSQSFQILRKQIFRSVYNSKVLLATDLERRLKQPTAVPSQESPRLYYHAFAAGIGELFPPRNCSLNIRLVVQINGAMCGGQQYAKGSTAYLGKCAHVPEMVAVVVDSTFCGKEMKWR